MLRSIFFKIFFFSGIIFICLIFLPALILPQKVTLFGGKIMGYWSLICLRIFLSVKIKVVGKENIIKGEKFFIACSHQSMFETFFLQTIFNAPIFILKKELLKIPFFGWCLKKIGAIDIIRETATKENLSFFDKILNKTSKSKRPLLIFPQGTRVPYKDRPPFKKGVARIYDTLKLPCIPVALNTGKVWPKNSFNKYPGKITISFLDPIDPGLEKEIFQKKLQNIIYKEIDLID